MLAVGAAGHRSVAHENLAGEIGAGAEHHRLGPVEAVEAGADALHPAVFNKNVHHLGLLDGKAGDVLQIFLCEAVVGLPVDLRPQGVHRRALAPVEHPALEGGCVGGPGHHAAQGINFADQMPLGGAADAGVAGHVADAVQPQGEQGGGDTQPGGGRRGLDARVARAHHDNVKIAQMDETFCVGSHQRPPFQKIEIIPPGKEPATGFVHPRSMNVWL